MIIFRPALNWSLYSHGLSMTCNSFVSEVFYCHWRVQPIRFELDILTNHGVCTFCQRDVLLSLRCSANQNQVYFRMSFSPPFMFDKTWLKHSDWMYTRVTIEHNADKKRHFLWVPRGQPIRFGAFFLNVISPAIFDRRKFLKCSDWMYMRVTKGHLTDKKKNVLFRRLFIST